MCSLLLWFLWYCTGSFVSETFSMQIQNMYMYHKLTMLRLKILIIDHSTFLLIGTCNPSIYSTATRPSISATSSTTADLQQVDNVVNFYGKKTTTKNTHKQQPKKTPTNELFWNSLNRIESSFKSSEMFSHTVQPFLYLNCCYNIAVGASLCIHSWLTLW